MKHIVSRAWNKNSRSEKVKCIIRALNSSGHAEVQYFKGRSYLATLPLGEGHPTLVEEPGDWNQVKIMYQGKDALNILDSFLGPEGQFFDNNFTTSEVNQIKTVLANNDIFTRQDALSRARPARFIMILFICIQLLLAISYCVSGDFIGILLSLGAGLCIILYLLMR